MTFFSVVCSLLTFSMHGCPGDCLFQSPVEEAPMCDINIKGKPGKVKV